MTGLVRRSSNGPVSPAPTNDGGVSTAELTFDGTGPRWEEMPAHVQAAATIGGPQAAAEVDTGPPGRARHRDGLYWQPWTVWAARRDGICLIRVRRMMSRLNGKRFKPTGELVVEAVEERRAVEPPARRRATIPVLETETSGESGSLFSPGADTSDEGLHALGYLPAAVQHEVLTDVTASSYSHGCLWQHYSSEELPVRHEISLLRLGVSAAVVVVATKETATLPVGSDVDTAKARVAAQPWGVTRYRYHLHDRVVRGELTSK